MLRRRGRISEFVSIYVNHQQQAVHIASDGGRICRPMIIVEHGESLVKEYHMQVSLDLFFYLAHSSPFTPLPLYLTLTNLP